MARRHPMGDDFAGFQDLIPQVLDEQTVLSYTAECPSRMLRDCFLTGTPDEVVDQVAEWRDFGVDYGVSPTPASCNPA